MKKAEGEVVRRKPNEIAKTLLLAMQEDPGTWFDLSEDLPGRGGHGSLYYTAGRHHTPLEVTYRKGRLMARWGSDADQS